MYMTDGQILVLSFFLVQMSIGLSFASFSYGFTGAPQALLQSCLTFGAFSFIIEGLNKKQAALAHSISSRNKCDYHSKPCPLALPLSVPLPDELKGAFSFFCKSLRKPKSANFPAATP
jgi:import inner membrane translocase subunit TIM22